MTESANYLDMKSELENFHLQASGKPAFKDKDGFVKVIFDAKYGEWLGCHMIGYNVTEMSRTVVAVNWKQLVMRF